MSDRPSGMPTTFVPVYLAAVVVVLAVLARDRAALGTPYGLFAVVVLVACLLYGALPLLLPADEEAAG